MYSYVLYQTLPDGSFEVLDSGHCDHEELERIRAYSSADDPATAVYLDVMH